MSKEKWTDDLFAEASLPGESLEESIEESLEQSYEESFEELPDMMMDETAKKTLSLEAGLQHLEKIVNTLDQKDLPLEKALSLFKEGVGLVQYCSDVLNQAEKQMEILLVGSDGQLKVKPASFEMEG
jgi:exodeoxyribonuclease VII small subunit